MEWEWGLSPDRSPRVGLGSYLGVCRGVGMGTVS